MTRQTSQTLIMTQTIYSFHQADHVRLRVHRRRPKRRVLGRPRSITGRRLPRAAPLGRPIPRPWPRRAASPWQIGAAGPRPALWAGSATCRPPPAACNTGTALRRRWSAAVTPAWRRQGPLARILRRRWRHQQQGPDDASPANPAPPHRRAP